MSSLYPYPETNSSIISSLKLEKHFEGGFFAQTGLVENKVPSPFADGAERALGSQIYYLLSTESPRGRMHVNKSATFHLHHAGRSEYTLLYPPTADSPHPRVETHVMGTNSELGEVKQLFVPSHVWKASRLPQSDLDSGDREHTGCLISEIVVPAWVPEDHDFLSYEKLLEIYAGNKEEAAKLKEFVEPLKDRAS